MVCFIFNRVFLFYKGEINETNKATSASSILGEDIKALKELYDDGILTKEEYEKATKAILNN